MFESVYRFKDAIHKQTIKDGLEYRKRHGNLKTKDERKKFYTNTKIAEMIGTNLTYVEQMVVIKKFGNPELVEMVRNGNVGVMNAYSQIQDERREKKEPNMMKYSKIAKKGLVTRVKNRPRTELGRLIGVLEGIENFEGDGMIISDISRYTKTSPDMARKNSEKLIEVGLITTEIPPGREKFNPPSKTYRLTVDGSNFLSEFKKFENLLAKYKLTDFFYQSVEKQD